jgi:hypothetical protein
MRWAPINGSGSEDDRPAPTTSADTPVSSQFDGRSADGGQADESETRNVGRCGTGFPVGSQARSPGFATRSFE